MIKFKTNIPDNFGKGYHDKIKIKSFKIYTDDTDEDKILVGDDVETALEILENNGYIVEATYELGYSDKNEEADD